MPKKKWCHCNGPAIRFAKYCSWCGFPIPPERWIKGQAFCFFYCVNGHKNAFFVLLINVDPKYKMVKKETFTSLEEALSVFADWAQRNGSFFATREIILGEFSFQDIDYLKKTVTLNRWWSTAQGKITEEHPTPWKIKVFDLQENL